MAFPLRQASSWENLVAQNLVLQHQAPRPEVPPEAYRFIEIVVGSSRAASLDVPNLYSIPGGKIIPNILPRALQEIDNRRFDNNHKIVYLVGGLPDITQMHRDPDFPRPFHPRYAYEEVIFPTDQDPDQIADRVKNDLANARTQILAEGATPVLSTIATQSISTWNFHLSLIHI